MISLTLISFLLIFTLTAHSQQKPVAGQTPQKPSQLEPIAKVPTIDPNMLRRLQGSVSRTTLINTLMGNQATRAIIENLANNAKMKVSDLQIKAMDGSPVTPTPQGQRIDQLNWNAGIKISMIKNNPKFFHLQSNQTLSVGNITSDKWHLDSSAMSYYINNDIFFITIGSTIDLHLHLPLNPATYMIAVQINSINPPEITIIDKNPKRKITNIVPLTSGDGWIGLTQIAPHRYTEGLNICHVEVVLPMFEGRSFLVFGGFTITRL